LKLALLEEVNVPTARLIRNSVAVVVSDLHVGDPTNDLDDFEMDGAWEHLLDYVIPSLGAPSALIIAGDFVDFPQILPVLGKHDIGDGFGITEEQALQRLRRAIAGHPGVFEALRRFVGGGNQVVILPGNHDIDLHFPSVIHEMMTAIDPRANDARANGAVCFVERGYLREKGIYIEHGNQYSFENRFDHWAAPIVAAPDGQDRIERSWGTLFMDMVYNDVEALHPYVNKVHPSSQLATLLWRDDKLASVELAARLLLFFARKGKRYLWERGLLGVDSRVAELSTDELSDVLARVAFEIDPKRASDLLARATELDRAVVASAGTQASPTTTSHGLLGRTDEGGIEDRAVELFRDGDVTIAVFGHTHRAYDRSMLVGGRRCHIVNTGSWVPHLELPKGQPLSLGDLRGAEFGHDLRYLVLEFNVEPRGTLHTMPSG
jgi:UDP-2,3-diacylglucosamine pyrophosphatase LpxH